MDTHDFVKHNCVTAYVDADDDFILDLLDEPTTNMHNVRGLLPGPQSRAVKDIDESSLSGDECFVAKESTAAASVTVSHPHLAAPIVNPASAPMYRIDLALL